MSADDEIEWEQGGGRAVVMDCRYPEVRSRVLRWLYNPGRLLLAVTKVGEVRVLREPEEWTPDLDLGSKGP